MARKHGRNGRLLAAVASGGTAEPIAFLKTFSISFATDNVDVTAFGDTNKVSVAGLPDSSGSYAGFYDTDTAQLFTAATDGVARKFYLYPDYSDATEYYFGTAIFDFSVSQDVAGAIEISGDWQAASSVSKVG